MHFCEYDSIFLAPIYSFFEFRRLQRAERNAMIKTFRDIFNPLKIVKLIDCPNSVLT